MKLVILTKKFGKNISGATLATQEIFKNIKKEFEEIVVITTEIGDYYTDTFDKVIQVSNLRRAKSMLKKMKNYIGYSDDEQGYILSKAGIPFIHTYHGNWPDMRKTSIEMFMKSIYFMHYYKKTLRKSRRVINVSYYMEHFTRKFNSNTVIIRNGIELSKVCDRSLKVDLNNGVKKIVMVGSIDARKYKQAIKIFEEISKKDIDIQCDIYGKIMDDNIAKKLKKFSFVNLKGHQQTIDYSKYSLLLNTSSIENLSISVTEALINKLPVISFNVGGLNEVIKHGLNGYLVEPFNHVIFSKYISKILNSDKEYTFSSFKEYNWHKSSQLYLDLFAEIEELL